MPKTPRGTVKVKIQPEADFSGAVKDIRSNFTKALKEGEKLEKGLDENAKSSGSAFEDAFKDVAKSFGRLKSAASDAGRDVDAEFDEIARELGDVFAGVFDGLAADIKGPVKKAVDGAKGELDELGDAGEDAADDLVKPFKDAPDEIAKGFEGLRGKVDKSLKGIGNSSMRVNERIRSSFASTRKQISGGFKGSGTGIKSGVLGAIKGLPLAAGTAAAAAGAAIGAAIGASISEAIQINAGTGTLSDRLGLSKGEAQELNGVVKDIFKSKEVVQSLDEITNAVALVKGEFRDLGNEDLDRVSTGALKIASVFDQDLNQVIKATSGLLKNGLAKDADEALDIITRGLQVGGARGQDLVDSFEEYANQLADVGFSGRDSLELITAALEGGARSTDGVADGLKESFLFITEGNKSTIEGLDSLGLSYDAMIAKINSGQGGEVITDIAVALQDVEGNAEKAEIAASILGGTYEQIGLNGLEGIAKAQEGIEGLDGATERLGENMQKGPLFYLDKLKRFGSVAIADVFVRMQPTIDAVGSALRTVFDAVEVGFNGGDTSGFTGRLETAAKVGERLKGVFDSLTAGVDILVASFKGEETGELSKEMQVFADVGEAAALYVGYLADAFTGLFASLTGGGNEGMEGAASAGFNMGESFKTVGPVILDVIAFIGQMLPHMVQITIVSAQIISWISRIVAWFIRFGAITSPLANMKSIGGGLKALGSGFTGFFGVVNRTPLVFRSALNLASRAATNFRNATTARLTDTKNRVRNSINSMVSAVTSLPGRVRSAASRAWDSIYSNFRRVINNIIGKWNRISFSVPSVNLPGVGQVGGQSVRVRQIPRLASGGVLDDETLFIGGEYPGARNNPEIVAPKNDIIDALMQALEATGGSSGPQTVLNIENVTVAEGVDLWEELDRTRKAFGGS